METVTLTRRHAEKQQARSAEEKEAEIAEEEFGLLPVATLVHLCPFVSAVAIQIMYMCFI